MVYRIWLKNTTYYGIIILFNQSYNVHCCVIVPMFSKISYITLSKVKTKLV